MTTIIRIYPNIIPLIISLYNKMEVEIGTITENVFKLLGGALGVKIFDVWLEKYKARKEKKQTDVILANLKDISDMDVIMTEVINNTKATRFLIFRGHDSGSVPNPKHPYYTRCLWQHTNDVNNVDGLKRRYDSLQVDVCYINMIIDILVNGSVKLKVSEMKDCLLKELYISEGVKYSEVFFLAQEKSNYIYYCSISTTNDDDFADNNTRVEIDLAINKLKQIFQKI